MVAVGCTGGKHRSVTLLGPLAHLTSGIKDYQIEHRDIDKDNKRK